MGNTQPSPYTHPDQSKHGEDQLIQESQASGSPIAEAPVGAAATQPGTMRVLTFHRARSVTILAGEITASAAAALPVTPLESLAITLYFAGSTGLSTFHEDGLTTSYRASGNQPCPTPAPRPSTSPASHSYYYLDGVDVTGGPTRGTVVAFGDSITNGHTPRPLALTSATPTR